MSAAHDVIPPPMTSAIRWAIPAIGVAGAVAAVIVLGDMGGQLKDLHVYQYAGEAVVDGQSPYARDHPTTGLPFTYPPFAAVLMVPLGVVPTWVAEALWSGASLAALGGAIVLVRRASGRATSNWLAVALGLAALSFEPVWQDLTFGQINLLLMLAVLVDVHRSQRHLSGVVLGIVAGVKLTPLVFVVLLVLAGQKTAAARAVLAFAGTVVVGLLAVPGAASYWTDGLFKASRVGPPALAHNQSVLGALTRQLDGPPPTLLWLAIAGPLAGAVLLVAAAWWRRGDPVAATCLAALAMLLASPVSWSHHWVWAVPVAVVLWARNRWVAVVWASVFVTRPILWPPWGEGRELAWSPFEHLIGNAYLLAALVVAAWAGAAKPTCR